MTELSWRASDGPRALSLGVNLLSREGNSQKWRMKDKTVRSTSGPAAGCYLSFDVHFWLDLRSVTFTLSSTSLTAGCLLPQSLDNKIFGFVGDQPLCKRDVMGRQATAGPGLLTQHEKIFGWVSRPG